MSRIEELDVLISNYNSNKIKADDYKKKADAYNKEIKSAFDKYDIEHDYTDEEHGLKATVSVSERQTIDEDKLLDVCKSLGLNSLIKTKEFVDMDELEKALYSGDISKESLLEINKCRKVTPIKTLKITAVKSV